MRADLDGDHWVACCWDGTAIGDNIELVHRELRCGFVEAVSRLAGPEAMPPVAAVPHIEAAEGKQPPRVPRSRDAAAGLNYLGARGIPASIVEAAAAAGALRFLPDSILFVGFGLDGVAWSATQRYFNPTPSTGGELITKRDLFRSDKAFPMVLPGSSNRVVIVEGGTSALAIQALARLMNRGSRTVIATGGVGSTRWAENELSIARRLVIEAAEVTIMGEHECGPDGQPDPTKQGLTDARRANLLTKLKALREGRLTRVSYPPAGTKDAAAWLELQANRTSRAGRP